MAKGDRANLDRLLRSAWERQTVMRAKSKIQERETEPSAARQALIWCRGVGAGALLIGTLGLITIIPFWWSVSFVYLGFALLLVDVSWLEEKLPATPKLLLAFVIIGIAVLLTRAVVFSSAPLDISAMAADANYPAGTTLAGIQWRSGFSELKLTIANPSDVGYEYVSIFVKPNRLIAAIGQISDLAGVSFMCGHDASVYVEDVDRSGHRTAVLLVLVATDAGYFVRMDKLPSGRPLELILAIAGVTELKAPSVFDRDYMQKVHIQTGGDNAFYWFGHADHSDDIYMPRELATTINVQVTYTAKLKPRTISRDVIPKSF